MYSNQDFSLQTGNSFNVATRCPEIYFPSSLVDLQQLAKLNAISTSSFYILGEGSNTLFVEQTAPVIIKPNFHGISVKETSEHYNVVVGASENWHQLVCFCLERGIKGLENLALIPGSVGAAPVQNIGAYGVDFSDFCTHVEFFDLTTKRMRTLTNAECQFAYRDSIFKQGLHNKGIITNVALSFPKKWQANINYNGLNGLAKDSSATDIMLQVIKLRESKLPDPKTLPNAGSFFKNPVVNNEVFKQLKLNYPTIPHYPQENSDVKLAAGWLIEQAGLKGFRFSGVGVHEYQALVLVNYSEGQGSDIVGLAKFIQLKVQEKFEIHITPEVRMVSAKGEVPFESLVDTLRLSEINYD
jgi:UDP-N-acetylmuramate dehydrogenase